jgi:hypothetical protein
MNNDITNRLIRHFGIMFLISLGVAGVVFFLYPGIPAIPVLPFSIVAVLMVDMLVDLIRRLFHKSTPMEKMVDCLFRGDEEEAEKYLDIVIDTEVRDIWEQEKANA